MRTISLILVAATAAFLLLVLALSANAGGGAKNTPQAHLISPYSDWLENGRPGVSPLVTR